MSVFDPDSFSSNGSTLFEVKEVLDKLIDDVDTLLTNEVKDFDTALLSPHDEDHAAKCPSCTQVFRMLRCDQRNENDLDWNPDDYKLSEGLSDSDASLEEIFLAYLSIPYNVIEDEVFENAIDDVRKNASNEEDVVNAVNVGDRDFDVLEGSDTSSYEMLEALLSIPNDDVESEGSEDDYFSIDALSEDEIDVVIDVVHWDDLSNADIVGDADDLGDLDVLDELDFLLFFLEQDDEEQQHQQQGSGDHPQEGPLGGNVLEEMD